MSHPKYLSFFSALFVTTLIVSNIIAAKIGSFAGYFLPTAVIIFPVSYILGDVLTEVYGYAASRKVIWTGFFCNLFAVIIFAVALRVPSAPFFTGQDAFVTVLSATPRLLVASFIAYLVGEFANSYVLAKMKIRTQGKYLWMRTIGSTLVGQGLDSAVFITLAFIGTEVGGSLGALILSQWIFKTAFEVIATPITYLVVNFLKRNEGIDTYDHATNFSPVVFS